MITYQFTIPGNQDDPDGNPIPKLKMTGRQHWTPKARRYVEWKSYVTRCFLACLETDPRPATYCADHRIIWEGNDTKPITIPPKRKAHMDIMIHWKDGKHPDPENVFGSIADALFENDKHVAGSFDFAMGPTGKGKVDVTIRI